MAINQGRLIDYLLKCFSMKKSLLQKSKQKILVYQKYAAETRKKLVFSYEQKSLKRTFECQTQQGKLVGYRCETTFFVNKTELYDLF